MVELFVVILIVGVLIAIIVPSLGSARRSARAAVCLANLRTLGTAVSTYAAGNRDLLPFAAEPFDLRSGRVAPLDVLADELSMNPPTLTDGVVAAGKPFVCPADKVIWPEIGASYRYVPADFMQIPEIWAGQPQAGVSRMYANGPEDLPLFSDLGAFHGPPERRDSVQVVLFTQAVGRRPNEPR